MGEQEADMAKTGHADSRIIGGFHPEDSTPGMAKIIRLETALALAQARNPGAALHSVPRRVEVGSYDLDGFDDGLGDLVGGDGDELAALVGMGDVELGRKLLKRRRQAQTIRKLQSKLGMGPQSAAAEASQAKMAMLRAANAEAMASGQAGTAGHYVADPGEREFYLPFQAAVSLAAAVGSTQSLLVTVQRPMMVKRIIIDAIDATSLADVLATVGVTGVLNGVQPIFNAQGIAPARAFAYNAVGNHIKTSVLRVGNVLSIALSRMVLGANAANVSGYVIGVSAEN